jgi:hypothetical protein
MSKFLFLGICKLLVSNHWNFHLNSSISATQKFKILRPIHCYLSAHMTLLVHLVYLLKFAAIVGPLGLLVQPAQAPFVLLWSERSRDSCCACSPSNIDLHARPRAAAPSSPVISTGAPSPRLPREADDIKIAPPPASEGPHWLHCPSPELPSRSYKRCWSIPPQFPSSQSPQCILYSTPEPPHHRRCAASHRRWRATSTSPPCFQ